jgi:hypothetical protein
MPPPQLAGDRDPDDAAADDEKIGGGHETPSMGMWQCNGSSRA